MTYHNYEFTAFAEADLLSGGDHNLGCGDTFTMPGSASLCITVCDNDPYLNGDNGWYDNQSEDHYGQNAQIEGDNGEVGNGHKIYAEVYHWVQDQHGNRYVMIEIQQEGTHSDYFSFHAGYGVPPAGAQLTITSTCNVSGCWVDYNCLDAGDKEPAPGNICGRLTFDADCNDTEWNEDTHSWDEGVEGQTVQLLDLDGNVVAETTTDHYGAYDFQVAAGEYRVKFPELDGYKFSAQNVGSDGEDSDADASGLTDVVSVTSGQVTNNVDAGIKEDKNTVEVCEIIEAEDMHLCGFSIGHDSNASGGEKIKSGHDGYTDYAQFTYQGEDGKCDLTVRAFDGAGDHSWHWWYGNHYDVNNEKVWVYVNGYCVKGPVHLCEDNNQWVDITVEGLDLNTGDQIRIYAAGDNCKPAMIDYVKLCCEIEDPMTGKIGDTVWLDADRDGIRDAGEAGVAGITVNLKDADGNVIATTTTDANGNYLFDNLAAGDYSVAFVPAAGTSLTDANKGGDDTADSDADVTTGMTDTITLGIGEENLTVDAGLVQDLGSLSGRYFCDENDNDVQDPSEPGIEGITVTLLNADGSSTGRTTVTDANGNYTFDGLTAGDYKVSFDADPTGKTFVDQDQGSDDTIDSDVDSTGTTNIISLGAGEDVTDIDAGVEDPGTASVGDTVWLDANEDGLLNNGESGVDGVTVKLLDENGDTVSTTVTQNGGQYLFSGLNAGVYSVMFVAPDDFGFTGNNPATGADDLNNDSDAGLNGMTDTFVLSIGEFEDNIDAGLVSLNNNPNPADDMAMTCADNEVTVDVLANDADPDGDGLTITQVDGQAIVEGQTITTSAGTNVTLTGGQLVVDGEAAYAALDIGEEAVENISYTTSDSNGGAASANLAVTFCGDANSVVSFCDSLPNEVISYKVKATNIDFPVEPEAFDLQIIGAGGDGRFEGVIFEEAYCLAVNLRADASESFASASTVTADMYCSDEATSALAGGNNAFDNLDKINWILNQGFEDQGYTGWEVQLAIWELTDGIDADVFTNFNAGYGDINKVDLIVSQANLNGDGFQTGVGDVVGVIVDPNPAPTSNAQPFIVAMAWEDYDCLC